MASGMASTLRYNIIARAIRVCGFGTWVVWDASYLISCIFSYYPEGFGFLFKVGGCMKRKRISGRKSRKMFTKGAQRTSRMNNRSGVNYWQRGGIRL